MHTNAVWQIKCTWSLVNQWNLNGTNIKCQFFFPYVPRYILINIHFSLSGAHLWVSCATRSSGAVLEMRKYFKWNYNFGMRPKGEVRWRWFSQNILNLSWFTSHSSITIIQSPQEHIHAFNLPYSKIQHTHKDPNETSMLLSKND